MRGVLASVGLLLVSQVMGCDDSSPEDEPELSDNGGQQVGLPGSKFEIEANANLIVNGPSGSLDWANVTDTRKADTASGNGDDSYSGGGKEDDTCPAVGTGSIPNNKSDLKTFGVYAEPGANPGDPGFLHMFWNRVQDPSGTTLMDFEFNQSATKCANGVNPLRTVGDLLVEYRLEQGGASATLKLREWSGTAWGAATDLTASGAAAGTINTSAITAANADGLGAMDVRTFGEASISLASIFHSDKCTTFGSAFVKSRSSDAFNSALKDYIAPLGVNISNCGKVIIRKTTDPVGETGSFDFSTTLDTDPASASAFSLGDGQSKEFTNALFGTGYTVTEATASGFTLAGIDCSKSSAGVTVSSSVATRTVTFDVKSATDTVDCTFTNRRNRGAVRIVKTRYHAAGGINTPQPHAGVEFTVTGGSLGAGTKVTTDATGIACVDNLILSDVAGAYTVTETVPAGYAGQAAQGISITTNGTCADTTSVVYFQNKPLTNLTVSVDSQVVGGTNSTITCAAPTTTATTPLATGDGGLTMSNLQAGTYTCTVVISQ